ncbi:MAG: DUF459 domain-containing protein [Leptospiraceae bacterium]|nr:DUF459 domain-containing protein [Leptospiraceae bacterium]
MNRLILLPLALLLLHCAMSPPTGRRTDHKDLQILLVGDSLMGGHLGNFLLTRLNSQSGIKAVRHWKISTGLSGIDRYSWIEAAYTYIQMLQPDILIVWIGANDSYSVKTSTDSSFKIVGSKEYKEHYGLKVKMFLHNSSPFVQRIYWIGLPAVDNAKFNSRYPVVNSIFQAECSQVENAVFINTWELTSRGGQPLQSMTDKNGRTGPMFWDEVHYSSHGGKVLGELVLDVISRDYPLPALE